MRTQHLDISRALHGLTIIPASSLYFTVSSVYLLVDDQGGANAFTTLCPLERYRDRRNPCEQPHCGLRAVKGKWAIFPKYSADGRQRSAQVPWQKRWGGRCLGGSSGRSLPPPHGEDNPNSTGLITAPGPLPMFLHVSAGRAMDVWGIACPWLISPNFPRVIALPATITTILDGANAAPNQPSLQSHDSEKTVFVRLLSPSSTMPN